MSGWRKKDGFGGHSLPSSPPGTRSRLRIVASGTVFITHTITLRDPPLSTQGDVNMRAQSIVRARGGSAPAILSILCQFGRQDDVVDAWLVAPVGRGSDASALLTELEKEGVKTKLCAKREGEGVPSAYVLKSHFSASSATKTAPKSTRTVINYNPIPDITHEEFIRLLAPVLYPNVTPSSPALPTTPPINAIPDRPSLEDNFLAIPAQDTPFDWLHFEGRTAQTTLSNMTGLDGFLRDRGWRGRVVFSLDCMRAGRPGQEALVPHADVIFFSKSYAKAQGFTSPRAFLLSQSLRSSQHSILVITWGRAGSALLSTPTKEYFQSSAFVPDKNDLEGDVLFGGEFESVRSSTIMGSVSVQSSGAPSSHGHGSRQQQGHVPTRSASSSAPTQPANWGKDAKIKRRRDAVNPKSTRRSGESSSDESDEDDATETASSADEDVVDETGADDAFVAGMIYALSRRILPNPLFTPIQPKPPSTTADIDMERGRWRLEECLRFATEMAGRKVRRKGFAGLAKAMENVGWFADN
ncbi:hypothetical protein FRC03_003444 [Tulasnella sp. 419]|nr:hypothetical protein FRC03_003444 [Tulasnella sp. 419]